LRFERGFERTDTLMRRSRSLALDDAKALVAADGNQWHKWVSGDLIEFGWVTISRDDGGARSEVGGCCTRGGRAG
jgi:hypothetical protein